MSSIFNRIEGLFAPQDVIARQRPEIFLPTGETTVLPFDQPSVVAGLPPENAGPPTDIAPKLRTLGGNPAPTTDAPLIAPRAPAPGTVSKTLAGGSWRQPQTAMNPGSNNRLPERLNIGAGLPPVGGDPFDTDINATMDDSIAFKAARDKSYSAWKANVLDNLPDLDPRDTDVSDGVWYSHRRASELPRHWSDLEQQKAIKYIMRMERGG